MKGSSKKASLLLVMMLIFTMPLSALAHSGRTDGSGGHKDNNNVSGLGYYHYHHGMGPHLHPNGVCPYDSPAPTSSYSKPAAPKQPAYTVEDRLFYIKNDAQFLSTIVKDGNSLVELRSLSEAFNISPEYRKDSNSILIDKMDGNKVVFFVNNDKIINKNGDTEWLPIKTMTYDGRTYIPLRAFADNLGFGLNYEYGTYYIG